MNFLCVVVENIDMSSEFCISAPKSWVDKHCPTLFTKYASHIIDPSTHTDNKGTIRGRYGTPFIKYNPKFSNVYYYDYDFKTGKESLEVIADKDMYDYHMRCAQHDKSLAESPRCLTCYSRDYDVVESYNLPENPEITIDYCKCKKCKSYFMMTRQGDRTISVIHKHTYDKDYPDEKEQVEKNENN